MESEKECELIRLQNEELLFNKLLNEMKAMMEKFGGSWKNLIDRTGGCVFENGGFCTTEGIKNTNAITF